MSIVLSDIVKIYNENMPSENEVLKGISLTVNKGEMLAIQGKSGVGKSTLLHIIGCLDQCTRGTYLLDGVDVGSLKDAAVAKLRNQKFGFILQDFGLINDDSVLQNVMTPMMFGNTRFREMRERAIKQLQRLGIEHLINREAGSLSGGEKQRVAVARALVNDPDYILADEPTGALDFANTELLMEALGALHKEGKTIIVITHDLVVAQKCERIIEIRDGLIYKE